MPKKGKAKKKGAGGKGKGKGGKNAAGKAAVAAAEAEEMLKTCKRFVKTYQTRCAASGSTTSQRILRDLRACVENERPLPKFILDLQEPARKRTTARDSGKKSQRGGASDSEQGPERPPPPRPRQPRPEEDERSGVESLTLAEPTAISGSSAEGPRLEPLVDTWRELAYRYLRCLHVWNLVQSDEAVVNLALFMESKLGPNLKVLELRDCRLSVWAIGRLARSLVNSQLAVLNLDYNRCARLAVGSLCMELRRCLTLHSLSLNYCHLDSSAAEPLSSLTATSQIKHLSLTGNNLHCDGASELVTALVSVCECSSEEFKPPLSRLNLQDNGIDVLGSKGMFEPVLFTRLLKRWLLSSGVIEDINLVDNWIGDAAGRELVSALQECKEAGLPAIRLTVTHRMSADIFASIVEHGTPGKGKKKGKRKK